jgi:prolipoprotein diacylglyceryltransferase
VFPVLNIGPLALQVPGLVILVGVWLGLLLSERYSKRHGFPPGILYNLVFIGLISGLLGARLIYIMRYYDIFAQSPASMVSLNPGLLDPFGGAAIGLICMGIYGARMKLNPWSTLDAVTPFLMVIMITLGFSHLASGSAFGVETGLPWGIILFGAKRHPTQVYEIILGTLILVLLWPDRSLWSKVKHGVYFLVFVSLSAASILLIEAYKADPSLLPGGYRLNQVLAWLVLAAGLYGIIRTQFKVDVQPEQD